MSVSRLSLVLVTALFLSACGKDGEPSTTPTTPNNNNRISFEPNSSACSSTFVEHHNATMSIVRNAINAPTRTNVEQAIQIVEAFKRAYSGVVCTAVANGVETSIDVDARTTTILDALKQILARL